jgi:hypothetical protein
VNKESVHTGGGQCYGTGDAMCRCGNRQEDYFSRMFIVGLIEKVTFQEGFVAHEGMCHEGV